MPPFNSYTIGLDLVSFKEYCKNHGKRLKFSRGDMFEIAGAQANTMGFVANGCFKYMVRNETDGKDYITGFAFDDEFVGDFPNCIEYQPAAVSIIAMTAADVYVIDGKELINTIDEQNMGPIYKQLFNQIYTQYLDSYRMTVKERYLQLLHRCPQIVQQINLKDIASFLNVTPKTISKIRKEITFEK